MKKPFIIRITRPDARSRYSGAILKLPATWTEMQDALERARITNESTNYIIEPVNIGHAFLREHITAVDNLYDLNYLAQCLWELDRIKTNAFEGLVEVESRNQLREPIEATRLLQLIHNLDNCVVSWRMWAKHCDRRPWPWILTTTASPGYSSTPSG